MLGRTLTQAVGLKIREYQRRIDAVLDENRELRRPPPPPISPEHAALRERIIEECRAIVWDHDAPDWRGFPMCTPESAHQSVRVLGLMFEEQRLLAKRDVVWRLYDAYQLE
jgi:hypothetical protein